MLPTIFKRSPFDDFRSEFLDFPTINPMFLNRNTLKTDIEEIDGGYHFTMDVPGFSKDDISVTLTDGYLVVSCEKKGEKPTGKGKYVRKERFSESSSRSFYVGDSVKSDDIKAKFENGVLEVSVTGIKKEKEIPNELHIEIK